MIIDKNLYMADGASSTVSEASTDYIDTLAAGDAYVGDWVVVKVGATAFTAGAGTPTATFQLQTHSDSDFDGGTTLVSSAALVAASLTANTVVWATRIPAGCQRYLRVYKVVNNNGDTTKFAGGTWDAFITKDIDLNDIPGAGL